MAKITEEELIHFLEKKINKLESKLLKAKEALENLKETHMVANVKLTKKQLNLLKKGRSKSKKNGKKKAPSTTLPVKEEPS